MHGCALQLMLLVQVQLLLLVSVWWWTQAVQQQQGKHHTSLCLLASPAGDTDDWEAVAALSFVDNARSPQLFRAFYLPRLSAVRNRHVQYVLLRRRLQAEGQQERAAAAAAAE